MKCLEASCKLNFHSTMHRGYLFISKKIIYIIYFYSSKILTNRNISNVIYFYFIVIMCSLFPISVSKNLILTKNVAPTHTPLFLEHAFLEVTK